MHIVFPYPRGLYVLPAQLLEEGGLVDRDSGHGGGIRNAMKFWKGEKIMLLAGARRGKDVFLVSSREEELYVPKIPHKWRRKRKPTR
jgi:hypothetical protein